MKRGTLTPTLLLRLMVLFAVGALTGCLGQDNQISQKTVLPNPAANGALSSLAIAEITGMPDAAANRLRAHLKAELASRKIALVRSPQKAAYSLKGFTSAASNAQGVTLVNIWEVLDKNGRRAHRIISEETGPASPTDDPWAGINSTMLSALAANLARDYKAWSSGRPSPAHEPAITRPIAKPVKKAPVRVARAAPLATGSIPAKPRLRTAIRVTPLVGAPGDGNAALAAAIKSALSRRGYKIVPAGQRAVYTISAEVFIGQPKDGRQDLAIDWKIRDAGNREIGVINQRNKVKAHALKGQWGATASGAAKAAASHMTKLLR